MQREKPASSAPPIVGGRASIHYTMFSQWIDISNIGRQSLGFST